MQRLLSLATLGVLGGLAWMFLSGGGLNQLANPGAAPGTQGIVPGAASTWNGAPSNGQTPGVQPAIIGRSAVPAATGPTIRIASYNIRDFGDSKMKNARVMETLAAIVRLFHVVAIQEISTSSDHHMPQFLQLVNKTGRQYNYVIGERVGNSKNTEQFAFVYDEAVIECDPQSKYTIIDREDNLLSREPLVAAFRTRMNPDEAFTFILVNVHTAPDFVPAEMDALAEVFRVVRQAGRGEDDIIMLGDFNADDTKMGRLTQIPGVRPLLRASPEVYSNTRESKLLDNLVVHVPSTTEFIRSGVYDLRRELQLQLTLPELDQISDHFPVWAEFSAYERDFQNNIASRRNTAR